MELDGAGIGFFTGRLTVHVNKVRHVTTISKGASDLGENED